MMRQVTSSSYGSRKRARKQSTPRRATVKTERYSVMPISRSLRYNGNCKIVRTATMHLTIQKTSGFQLGATAYRSIFISYSPTNLRFHGSETDFTDVVVPQYAELAAVWDRVKIDKVELQLSANVTDAEVIAHGTDPPSGEAPSYNAPRIILCNDYNGPMTGSTSSITELQQGSDTACYVLNSNLPPVKWTVKPKFQRLVQYTTTQTATEPATGFIDSSVDIPHLGTRLGLLNVPFVSSCRLGVVAKFYFSCKNLK